MNFVKVARHGFAQFRIEAQSKGNSIKSRSISIETSMNSVDELIDWVHGILSNVTKPVTVPITTRPEAVNVAVYPAGNSRNGGKWISVYHVSVDEVIWIINKSLSND